jgi:hypothetical protein
MAKNFIDDDGETDYGFLAYPKTNKRAIVTPSKEVPATHWNAANQALDHLRVEAVDGRLRRRSDNVVNIVHRFGAVNDGTSAATNDAAFADAIEYLTSIGGGVIEVPDGDFLISTSVSILALAANGLQKNIIIRGTAKSGGDGAGQSQIIWGGNTTDPMFVLHTRDSGLENLRMRAPVGTPCLKAVDINYPGASRGVLAGGPTFDAGQTTNCTNVHVKHCFIQDDFTSGIVIGDLITKLDLSTGYASNCDYITIHRVLIEGQAACPITNCIWVPNQTQNVKQLTIDHCWLFPDPGNTTANTFCIKINRMAGRISHCSLGWAQYGLYVERGNDYMKIEDIDSEGVETLFAFDISVQYPMPVLIDGVRYSLQGVASVIEGGLRYSIGGSATGTLGGVPCMRFSGPGTYDIRGLEMVDSWQTPVVVSPKIGVGLDASGTKIKFEGVVFNYTDAATAIIPNGTLKNAEVTLKSCQYINPATSVGATLDDFEGPLSDLKLVERTLADSANLRRFIAKPTIYGTGLAAANGVQRNSSDWMHRGYGWDSSAGASKPVDFGWQVQPAQAAGNPTGVYALRTRSNEGSWTTPISIGSDGQLDIDYADAAADTIVNVFDIGRNTSGTPAPGLGQRLRMRVAQSANTLVDCAAFETGWVSGAVRGYLAFKFVHTAGGGLAEAFRVQGSSVDGNWSFLIGDTDATDFVAAGLAKFLIKHGSSKCVFREHSSGNIWWAINDGTQTALMQLYTPDMHAYFGGSHGVGITAGGAAVCKWDTSKRFFQGAPNSAPTDADIPVGWCTAWMDETNDAVTIRARESGGTYWTAPIYGATKWAAFGASPQSQQTSGADLTNNVTSGGTSDQIDNWTDLTTYATDAAAIRNAVYQLSRKLKQVNDALRDYGLLT